MHLRDGGLCGIERLCFLKVSASIPETQNQRHQLRFNKSCACNCDIQRVARRVL